MKKIIWAFGYEDTNRNLAVALRSLPVEIRVIPNYLAIDCITSGETPDLVVTGWLGGGAMPDDRVTPPGQQVIKALQHVDMDVPIILWTGAAQTFPPEGGSKISFPGQDVSILHKVTTTTDIIRHFRQRLGLAGPGMEVGL